MKWILLVFAIIAYDATPVFSQTPRDSMEIAKREVLRRGAYVVSTGTVRSGLVEQALAPPADDSDKWFLTLIGETGETKFETMRRMLHETKDQALLAWVDVNDLSRSTMVYHERHWDLNGPQRDWLKPLKAQVEKYGLPAVVVQPCRNGKFGDPSTIVKIIHGTVKADELAEKIREAVVAYVQSIDKPIHAAGVTQTTDIGVAPPFHVPTPNPGPKPTEQPAPGPFEFPNLKPAVLTVAEIKEICPDATPEFVLQMLQEHATNREIVGLRWMVAKSKPAELPKDALIPVPEQIVPARPKEDSRERSFFLPADRTPETLALKFLGVFLAGIISVKMISIPWGTLIGDAVGKRNGRDDIDPTEFCQTIIKPRRTPPGRTSNAIREPNDETNEPNDETNENTNTRWRPSNAKS
jgi:hypothetical protein